MRHLKKGRALTRTSSHKKALMRTLAASLFEHKKISTTEAKAKELRPYAEKLISKAKRALAKEKQGLLPQGQTIDVHNRRVVYRDIRSKAIVQELFDTIAPLVAERPGGYTRIIKTGRRLGDSSRTAIIELVDWSAPQDGATSFKTKKKGKPTKDRKERVAASKVKKVKAVAAEEEVDEAVVTDTVEETVEVQETVIEETTEAQDEPQAEVEASEEIQPDDESKKAE